jgi:peptidoglycan-associated lipoprotein
MSRLRLPLLAVIGLGALAAACGGKKAPVVNPPPAPPPAAAPSTAGPTTPPPAPPPAAEPPSVPMEPMTTNDLNAQPLEDINQAQPLKPAFFALDSDTLDDAAQQALTADAQVLKQYANWAVTIEGHCDERGSAEYNLALGERRALAAKNYLVSLGIAADRLKTVSYGKEFPFDPGHDEAAWSQNRRAHFVVTGK